ncbi:BAP31 protein, partial [Sagittarius serpentarius]|nr:BAP31 protein [Sagittarius serpentarius]
VSLQRTAVATFLYTKVFLILLLCIPFALATRWDGGGACGSPGAGVQPPIPDLQSSPNKWQKIFKLHLMGLAVAFGDTVFLILIVILVLLLFGGLGMVGQGRLRDPAHPASHSPLRCLVTLILQQAMPGASTEAFWKQAIDVSQATRLGDAEDNEALQKV